MKTLKESLQIALESSVLDKDFDINEFDVLLNGQEWNPRATHCYDLEFFDDMVKYLTSLTDGNTISYQECTEAWESGEPVLIIGKQKTSKDTYDFASIYFKEDSSFASIERMIKVDPRKSVGWKEKGIDRGTPWVTIWAEEGTWRGEKLPTRSNVKKCYKIPAGLDVIKRLLEWCDKKSKENSANHRAWAKSQGLAGY